MQLEKLTTIYKQKYSVNLAFYICQFSSNIYASR
jgi:hypothetical protein